MSDGVILLTPFREEDARTMVEWDHDPDMARWFDFPPLPPEPAHLEHVLGVIRRWRAEYRDGVRIPWAVRAAATRQLLGHVELRPRPDGGADASYATHPAHRGRGVATRALRLACHWAFDQAGFDHIVVQHDARNRASAAVARRVGFVQVDRRPGGLTYQHAGSPGDAVILELRAGAIGRRAYRGAVRSELWT